MPLARPLRPTVALAAALLALAGCASAPSADDTSDLPAAAGALRATTVSVPSGMRSAPFDRTRQLLIPAGWKISVYARVPDARLLVRTPDGKVLVSRPAHGDVVLLTPSASGTSASQRTLLSGLRQPHGLAFRGNTLYVAESNQVDAYDYASGKATRKRTFISGLPDAKSPELGGQYAHALKSVAVAANGTVYVSVGSTGNISAQDRAATPERATILRWTPSTRKLSVYAHGVRNGTGLSIDPAGAVWTAINNRDQAPYPYHKDFDGNGSDDYGKVMTSYVNDHPIEPIAKLTPGRDLGWPYCNPNPDVTPGAKNTTHDYSNRPFVRDYDTNRDGSKKNCAILAPIEQGLPAHSAPLGMTFGALAGYGTGALVAAHGSWNRNPPRAPSVSFFHWVKGQLGSRQIVVSGWQDSSGNRWGRPVGVLRGSSAMYVSDDSSGTVYRLTS